MKERIKDVCAALSTLKNDILLLTHILMKKFNLFILKFGSILHTLFIFPILYKANIHPNNPIYWSFLLNHIMFSYFLLVRGIAYGISKTIDIISHEEAAKTIQEELNKNN
jgi:hypothetical protein